MILAIDLGSTNFKAALFDKTDLNRIGSSSLPTPYLRNEGDGVEMDAGAVQQTVVDLVRATCGSAGVGTESIASVAVTSQAQNFTFLDKNGRAKMPVISWMDNRSVDEARDLWATMEADWHRHCSIPTLSGQMQLAHLLWVHRHMPEVFDGDFDLVTLPGLVFHMLAGINLTDTNLAAMNGTYSLLDQGWRVDGLTRCGVAATQMPQLVPVGTPVTVRTGCAALDLAEEIRLVSAGNDQTAGAFGNGCREGDVVVTLGTALVAYRYAGVEPGPYTADGCWGPYPGQGCYEMAFINEGCLSLDWAREQLMPGADISQFDAAVAEAIPKVSENTGTFDPTRIRTPEAWQGTFVDLPEKAYAVLEGITCVLHGLVFEELGCSDGIALRVIGGGSRSKVWRQLIADVLGCPVCTGTGDSLLGAAGMAAGRAPSSFESDTFHPTQARRKLLATRRSEYDAATGQWM